MSDEAALLAAIRANPDEDTPRLVYADWLDEHATTESERTRAEFIRLECELSQMDEDDVSREGFARIKELRGRINEIEKQYKKIWCAPLKGKKGPLRGHNCFFHMRRGFPDKAYAPADRYIAEGDALFRLAPVTYLDAKDVTPENIGPLLARPWMANVRSLTLSGPYTTGPRPDWSALADCPHLRNLDYLWLSHGGLTRSGGARLAAANPFPRLKHFMMSDCNLDGAVPGLFGGPVFGELEEVYFHKCKIDATAVDSLSRSAALSRVTKISLPNQPLTSDTIRRLTAGSYWPNLRELVLWHCELGDEGAAALAAAGPAALRLLNLSGNRIGSAGVAAMGQSTLFRGLEVLDLGSNPLWDRGVEALLRSPHLGNLLRLHLGGVGMGPVGAKLLAACPSLTRLLWLTLYSNVILAEGALALADSPYLSGLDYLPLSNIRGKARTRLSERFGDRVRF